LVGAAISLSQTDASHRLSATIADLLCEMDALPKVGNSARVIARDPLRVAEIAE
jgi:hypothetical protein